MDQPSGNASHSDAHFNGDWSPRISFSHSFACIQRVPSPTKKSPLHDSEFEFSRSVGTDLLSAEELFCNGKLRPLKLSCHESGKREWKASQRRQDVQILESNMKMACGGNALPSSKEDRGSVCGEDAISRWEKHGERSRKTQSNAGEAKSLASREVPISVHRRAEKVEIGMKPPDSTSPTSRKKCLSSASAAAEKLEDGNATLRSPTSREGPVCACKLEMGRKAGKSGSPTSREELISGRKFEMGENAGKSRLPTSREELIPACKPETSSRAGKLESPTTREDLVSACSNLRKSERGGTPVTWREEVPWAKKTEEDEHANLQSRRFSKHPRSASMIIEGSWRLGNRSCVSLTNSRCPSPSRSFSLPSTTPASPSACSSAYSGFSSSSVSSSSSSKYRSKIKEFFKLRKLAVPREDTLPPGESVSPSTCRVPVSPRSLFAFFKSRESSKASSKSSSFVHEGTQQERENVCAIPDHSAKSKDLHGLPHSHTNKELSIPCLTLPNGAKPPPNPSFPFHFSPSSSSSSTTKAAASTSSSTATEKTPQRSAECAVGLSSFMSKAAGSTSAATTEKATQGPQRSVEGVAGGSKPRAQKSCSRLHEEGPAMLAIEEGLWEEGSFNRGNGGVNAHTVNGQGNKQGDQRVKKVERGSMMMMGGAMRPKGLERPLPYTSSVRVTPVLNVPSCITPSLRKTKPSSLKPKSFSFESLFATKKDKALLTPPPSY